MKYIYIIILLFMLSCQFTNKYDLSQVSVIQNQNGTLNEVVLVDKNGKEMYKSTPKDFNIIRSNLASLFFDSLQHKHHLPCEWELFLKNRDNSLFKFEDLKGLNYILENNLKIKSIIPFDTKQGTSLKGIILNSQIPLSQSNNIISQNSKEWIQVDSIYSISELDEMNKLSDTLKTEKNLYLPQNTYFTVSDFCNFNSNMNIVKEISKNQDTRILYICLLAKVRFRTSKFDRDDLFFKFEQYINDKGFLQIKKSLLNPYSFNRKRIYIFE